MAFGAGLSWAGLDAVRKSLSRDVEPMAMVVWLTLGPALLFGAWAIVDGGWFSGAEYVPIGSATLLFNTVAYVSFMRALRISSLSTTVPLLSLTPVLTAAAGAIVLTELPAAAELVGIGVVVAGALLLHARQDGGLLGWLSGVAREPGARLMLVTAASFSMASTLDKLALAHASVPAHALVQTGGMALSLAFLLGLRKRIGELRAGTSRPWSTTAGVGLTVAAIGLQLLAYRLLFVAKVETVKRGVGVVMALALGRVLFDERITAQKMVAIGAIAMGTVLVVR